MKRLYACTGVSKRLMGSPADVGLKFCSRYLRDHDDSAGEV